MQHDFGGPREASPAELRFLSRLLDLDFRPDSESRVNGRTGRRNANDVWLHHDSSGRPLVSVTRSRIVNGKLAALALRLDYDGSEIRGGWVPESRLLDELDASGPDGIIGVGEPEALADLAGDWFDSHEVERIQRGGFWMSDANAFEIEIGTFAMLYREGDHQMAIDIDFRDSRPILYGSEIRAWRYPFEDEPISADTRDRVLRNVATGLRAEKIEVEVEPGR